MSKQQSAGALAHRVEALEKTQADHTKRIDALLEIIEKQSEQLKKLGEAKASLDQNPYVSAFTHWPGNIR